ncbi:hydroxymethylbilane synthase [Rhodocaloribacter sp.]
MKTTLTAGTRRSKLAIRQTTLILNALTAAWPDLVCEAHTFSTRGDEMTDVPLPQIGGKGLFTAELERALREGIIDLAVHSLKDLPTEDAPGLTLGAIPKRADAADVLVSTHGYTLATLPPGATVGTSSRRRAAQLRRARPDLVVRPIRGNIDTRVGKVLRGEYDAAVMAAAGLIRLGLTDPISERFSFEVMLPAPGQGALAVQCRAGDARTLERLAVLEDADTRRATTAERAFLQALGGGCATPVGAFAETGSDGTIRMTALIASLDGQSAIHVRGEDTDPLALGERLAEEARREGALEVMADG